MLSILFFLMSLLPLAQPNHALGAASGESGAADVSRAVRSYVAATTPWRESDIQVRQVNCLSGEELPAGAAAFTVVQEHPPTSFRNMIVQVEVMPAAGAARFLWVLAQVSIRTRVVQAARKLEFGHTIGPEDVLESDMELPDPRLPYLLSTDEAIGKVIRRSLSPGNPLTRDTLSEPLLVRSGETVRLILNRGPVQISMMGRAEQSGRLGQIIRIRNPDFGRAVNATVTSRGEVKVD